MEPITYRTKSLQEAAALWTQQLFEVDYSTLEPIEGQINKFRFVFHVYATEAEFNAYKLAYVNQKSSIEPKLYDSRLNSLRDNLAIAKV